MQHGVCFFQSLLCRERNTPKDETIYYYVGGTFAPLCLTSIFARCFRCSRSTWSTASSRLSSSAASRFTCSLDDAASALAWHASAFLATAMASIFIDSARAARAVAVAAAEAPSAAESEAACRQSRLHPRNARALSLSRPTRIILTEWCNAEEVGCRGKKFYMRVYASWRKAHASASSFRSRIATRLGCSS